MIFYILYKISILCRKV